MDGAAPPTVLLQTMLVGPTARQPAVATWQTHVDRFAVASLVCSLLGFVTGVSALLGITFGLMARARIKRSESSSGRTLATWGIVVGLVALATAAGAVTVLIDRHSGSGTPRASNAVLSGRPEADVRLAEQELVPQSVLPSGWVGAGFPMADDTFFGGLPTGTVAPLASCVGVDPASIDLHPAEAANQMYGPPSDSVDFSDTVDVYPTKENALIDVEASTSTRVEACLLQLVVLPGLSGIQQAIGKGRTFSPPTVTQRPIVMASDHDVDIETAYPWAIGPTHSATYFDSVIVQQGRSESNLLIVVDGGPPPALSLVDRLVDAAARRMPPG